MIDHGVRHSSSEGCVLPKNVMKKGTGDNLMGKNKIRLKKRELFAKKVVLVASWTFEPKKAHIVGLLSKKMVSFYTSVTLSTVFFNREKELKNLRGLF